MRTVLSAVVLNKHIPLFTVGDKQTRTSGHDPAQYYRQFRFVSAELVIVNIELYPDNRFACLPRFNTYVSDSYLCK